MEAPPPDASLRGSPDLEPASGLRSEGMKTKRLLLMSAALMLSACQNMNWKTLSLKSDKPDPELKDVSQESRPIMMSQSHLNDWRGRSVVMR
jgi:hypothetical protein